MKVGYIMKLKFDNKIVIFGYGLVGKSFLRLLKNEIDFDINNLYVVDMSKDEKDEFLNVGGLKDNFITAHIQKQNYQDIYSNLLSENDIMIDFLEHTKNIDSLTWCLNNGIFYLSTSDGSWPEDDESTSSYDNFLLLRNLQSKYLNNYPTATVEIGCNPGIVSLFTKQGIKEIVNVNKHLLSSDEIKEITKYLNNNNYNKISELLQIEAIIISDYDTLKVDEDLITNDILYNTWSPLGLFDESISLVELSLGTAFPINNIKPHIKIYNPNDGYCMLNLRGVDTLENTYSPHGNFDGHIITHEETLTIANYLTVRENDNLVYMPTVYFSYRPNEYAFKSLANVKDSGYKKPTNLVKLTDTLKTGGEYVGVILISKRFGNYYFGSGVEINELKKTYKKETPTIIQVTATAISAFKWLINNPKKGIMFPEDLPEEFILNEAKKYLGSYDFHKIDANITPLKSLHDIISPN